MKVSFKETETIELLKQLVEIPSPSGFTKEVMNFIARYLEDIQVPYKKTNKAT
jgi:putative aminopeptidase FrvX